MSSKINKIYIAGPITSSNEPDNNRAAFDYAEDLLEISYQVINPWRNYGGGRPDAQLPSQADFMRASFHQLLQVDVIYMLAGWEVSENCHAELAVAQCLNLEIIYQS